MNLVPDPLHPAIVHFPIVLILLGTAAAMVAACWRGGHLPRYTAVLLALGALGAWAAVETGESAGGLLATETPAVETLLDAHETWAKRTLTITIVAAVFAAGAACLGRWPRVARAAGVLTAVASLAAAYGVHQTGHRGGALVYRQGAGVRVTANGPAAAEPAAIPAKAPGARPKQGDAD